VEDVLVNAPRLTDTPGLSLHALQATFLVSVWPRVVTHGRVYFRHLRRADREEAVQEMVGLSWMWFVRLAGRGQDGSRFASGLARFAARAVRSGRRVCGQESGRDALSPSAQRRHRFLVSSLPEFSTLSDNLLSEALADNTQTPPDEQAAFRADFAAWRASRNERDRQILHDLMVGERTRDVAARHGITPGRVSQLRRELHDDWERFCAAPPQVV
jgi:hypothetical protein